MTLDEITLAEFLEELVIKLEDQQANLPLRDDRMWHTFLYRLAKGEPGAAKPRFVEQLSFEWDAPYPRCIELAEFLQALHWNECVAAANPTFERFMVDPSLRDLCNARDKDAQLVAFIDSAANRGVEHFRHA